MWDKAISRILGPIGLAVLAGAVLGTAAAPALRKEARKVAVQATKGILTLKEGAQRLAEEARSSWKELVTKAQAVPAEEAAAEEQ